jgi:hypothetical protein
LRHDPVVKYLGRVPAVSDQPLESKSFDKRDGLVQIRSLPGRHCQAQRVAQAVDRDMDFGAAPAPTPSRSHPMWDTRTELLDSGSARRLELLGGGETVSYGRVIQAWRTDATFRSFFIELLAASPYRACYWETPAVCAGSLDAPFECVLLDSALLAGVTAEPGVFAEHFDSAAARDDVVAFPNLGRDAVLIAPCPVGRDNACAHLAAFARGAPAAQQHALWRRVGSQLDEAIKAGRRVWVSTAGQGVFWLHVRLDDAPKYYNYAPYRHAGDRRRPAGAPQG